MSVTYDICEVLGPVAGGCATLMLCVCVCVCVCVCESVLCCVCATNHYYKSLLQMKPVAAIVRWAPWLEQELTINDIVALLHIAVTQIRRNQPIKELLQLRHLRIRHLNQLSHADNRRMYISLAREQRYNHPPCRRILAGYAGVIKGFKSSDPNPIPFILTVAPQVAATLADCRCLP